MTKSTLLGASPQGGGAPPKDTVEGGGWRTCDYMYLFILLGV